ncbi:DinB family protein [Asticcacaulis sp. ZE23SCel15]|uniref:DinB family protein n=1 Tax=Asticcacaulis sp. ZE23SCel15 TaxID=3059027 RepID=UPI00265EB724|nr:DinB family protein [Asticcacaulis sp. ZE23SCel15]WKL55792.1 DinB family protein [Asticcacaulis sp. ZE23SCel15]
MSQKAALAHLAQYNQWMNAKLIAAIRPISHDDLWADRGAFFGSVMGTLNHLIVADIIWGKRLAGHTASGALTPIHDYPMPTGLNAVLYERLEDYIPARQALDHLMITYIDSLDDAALETPLSYVRGNNEPHTKTLGLVLTHIFNHQTHHRGQTTTLLSQMGIDVGVTDILVLIPEL